MNSFSSKSQLNPITKNIFKFRSPSVRNINKKPYICNVNVLDVLPRLTRRITPDTPPTPEAPSYIQRYNTWSKEKQSWMKKLEVAAASDDFNEIWRILNSPRGGGHTPFIRFMAERWARSKPHIPVEDYISEFSQIAWEVSQSFNMGDFWYGETLILRWNNRARDMLSEARADKRRANYDAESFDKIAGVSPDRLPCTASDPLDSVLGEDYRLDTRLSEDERKVAALLVEGYRLTEIGRELGVHHERVRRIRQRLKDKLEADL